MLRHTFIVIGAKIKWYHFYICSKKIFYEAINSKDLYEREINENAKH